MICQIQPKPDFETFFFFFSDDVSPGILPLSSADSSAKGIQLVFDCKIINNNTRTLSEEPFDQ